MNLVFPPALILFLAVALWPFLKPSARRIALVAAPLLTLLHVFTLTEGMEWRTGFLIYEVIPLQVDALRLTFGIAFALVTTVAAIYAWHHQDAKEQAAALLYAAGALTVVFAGDLFTLLVGWEIMAVASTLVVWRGGTPAAQTAGFRYLIQHLLGGSLLLAGVVLHFSESGSLVATALPEGWTLGKGFLLLGILVNAGMPPLHTWIPDAYPRGSVTGSVFLSAFSTKTAVFALALLFPGWEILLPLGIIMTLWGVYYAVLANDIRLILAYHIISQVGYMVAAIGAGGDLGINAGAAHAFNNLLYKTLMFMAAGAVLHAVGKTKLTDLGGLAPAMKWVVGLYLVGAASISGFPLFNGFVSKAMALEAAKVSGGYPAYYLLVFAAIGTFLSVGIKLPYYTWFYRPAKLTVQRPVPRNMLWAMGILAFLCVGFGAEDALFNILPFPVEQSFYSIYNIVEVLQLSLFTFVVFWLFRHKILGEAKMVLDVDWFFRRPAPWLRHQVVRVNAFFAAAQKVVDHTVAVTCRLARNPIRTFGLSRRGGETFHSDEDRPALGSTVLLTSVSMVVLLIWVYFY